MDSGMKKRREGVSKGREGFSGETKQRVGLVGR